MNFETAMELANNGDVGAMLALGRFYGDFDDRENLDMDEAYRWYSEAARSGNLEGMVFAATIASINSRASLQIAPDSWEKVIPILEEALSFAQQAEAAGAPGSNDCVYNVKSELGEAYVKASCFDPTANNPSLTKKICLERAIGYLKDIKQTVNSDSEFIYYLGYAIFKYSGVLGKEGKKLTDEDSKLMYRCFKECVSNNNPQNSNIGMSYMFLGMLHTYGIGCEINYDESVHCYQMATQFGEDCSQQLKQFKKKLFGGYTFIG